MRLRVFSFYKSVSSSLAQLAIQVKLFSDKVLLLLNRRVELLFSKIRFVGEALIHTPSNISQKIPLTL